MPKRTNEFQELVSLIQKAVAPRGAKVTDSALDERGREIDILIESQVGPYRIKIAVEAKDEGRKMDMTKFESIIGKYLAHGGVKADKVVIITHRGFFRPVVTRARDLGIELMTVEEAKETDWQHFPDTGTLSFSMPPHICEIRFEPPIKIDMPKQLWHEARMICAHGHDHGPPMQVAVHLVFQEWFSKNVAFVRNVERQVRESPGGQGFVSAAYERKGYRVAYQGNEYPIEQMHVRVHFVTGKGTLKCTGLNLSSTDGGSKLMHHFEGVAAGKKLTFLLPDGPKSPQAILKIASAKTPDPLEEKQRSKVKGARRKKGAKKRGNKPGKRKKKR